MKNFSFYSPTKVIFGKDVQNAVGEEVVFWGGTKVLIHYGGGSAVRSGLIDTVKKSLEKAGVAYVELGGVKPNPRLSLIREGIALCQKENVDFILAVGGGSAIDSAKGIALGVANPDVDVWKFYTHEEAPKAALPVADILTIAAAGSETSPGSVVTNEDGMLKRSIDTDILRPRFAMMNPELTYTLPKYQISCGIVDIMMHTIERYFGPERGNDLTDRIGESVLTTCIKYGPMRLKDTEDYKAASEVMWAGSLSHNGLTGCGNNGDFATHKLGHELSAKYDVAHGASLSAVWGSWARYVMHHNVNRFAAYAVKVWGCDIDSDHPEWTAMKGIEMTENFFASIDMPISIPELGLGEVSDQDLREMAEKCSDFGTTPVGNFLSLDQNDMYKIYKMANSR